MPGYELREFIAEGEQTEVARAVRADGTSVVIKTPREDAEPEVLRRLRHEHAILRTLEAEGVVRAYGLESLGGRPALVLEDVGGEALSKVIANRRLSLDEVLSIGTQLASILADIHAAGVIHKDLNPSNIIYVASAAAVKLTDFGIASRVPRLHASLSMAKGAEGSLPYMSPEQTGRMNRPLDYRTDFYSLGATLYELLTGQPLFAASEPMEWLHCHVAKEVRPPALVDSQIPQVVSDIVMKLLAKNAEDRYQSALGLRDDLQRCRDALARDETLARFPLGQQDVCDRFSVSQRLYGREREVAALVSSFQRTAAGDCEVVLVAGEPGVGKTSLIRELYRPVTARRGYFLSGKYDALRSSAPYSAFVAALRELVRQLLTEEESQLEEWRQKLSLALGPNGRMLTELMPELELITGPQPELPPLSPLQAEQLFHRTFRRFIQTFCDARHPLVVFLDDLQWADRASLNLIEMLAREGAGSHLLLIGAYRDNEIGPAHPLAKLTSELRERSSLTQIELKALTSRDLAALIGDSLRTTPEKAAPLADLVAGKTGGNPFFVEEFLKYLHQRGLICFAPETGAWRWDLERSRAEQITGNVVHFLTAKLQRIGTQARRQLELAACCGTRFRLSRLTAVSGLENAEVLAALDDPLQMGLIFPLGDGYRLLEAGNVLDTAGEDIEFAFAHDRIRQAAYELMSEDERRSTHLLMGRIGLEHLSTQQQDEMLFDVANQFNRAHQLITDSAERERVAEINLRAGRQAKAASAYAPALDYMAHGLALLEEASWQIHYQLALDLHVEAAELAYLQHDMERMDALLEIALERAATLLDCIPCYEIKISALVSRGRMNEALDLGLPILRQLGHRIPAHPGKARKIVSFLTLWMRLKRRSERSLLELPPLKDPYHIAALRLSARMISAAYLGRPSVSLFFSIDGIKVSLRHGVSVLSPSAYAGFGMALAHSGNYQSAQRFGDLALNLADRLDARSAKPRVQHIYNAFVRPWREPLRASLEPLLKTHELALDNGDFEYANHALNVYAYYAWFGSNPLDDLLADLGRYRATVLELRQGSLADHVELFRQAAKNLSSGADVAASEAPWVLEGESGYQAGSDRPLIWYLHVVKTQLYYLFGRHAEALEQAQLAARHIRHVVGSFTAVSFVFYKALAMLASARDASGPERKQLLKRVRRDQQRLRKWADNNPASCANKLELVEAERRSLLGDSGAAEWYDRAIQNAERDGNDAEAALACECAARHYLAAKRRTIGLAYLREAIARYERWGARSKVADLEARHASLLHGRTARQSTTVMTSGNSTPLAQIALSSLTKALRAIAEERAYSGMVETIIKTALEFAAAQHGVLLLRDHQGNFFVQAEASVDKPQAHILQSIPMENSEAFCHPVVNYVRRTGTPTVINDAQGDNEKIPGLVQDSYVQHKQVRSVLCLPISTGAGDDRELIALLYLENNRAADTFTDDRIGVLEIICMAAAGRLELAYKAAVDGLTQLYNHAHMQNVLRQQIHEAQRRKRPLSLVMVDIDHFKRFNDSYGHQAGDAVLAAVAGVVTRSCRVGDTAARYGGEELAVILPETDAEGAAMVAERIRAAVADLEVPHEGQALSVTVSLGVATLNLSLADAQSLIRAADGALYQSKAAGRNCVTFAGA